MKKMTEDIWVKACVFGPAGTGKTNLGVTAPGALILLSEQQGALHIRQAAQRLGIPVPNVVVMESLDDYRQTLKALKSKGPGEQIEIYVDTALAYSGPYPTTVVVDSLTDCARLIISEIRAQSPPTKGKDGLPVDSQRFWNVLQDRFQNLVMGFRNVPAHVLFLALADDRMTGEEGSQLRSVSPDLPMRKLSNFVAGAVNLQGYSYRSQKQGKVGFGVLFQGPEAFLLKHCAPLRATEAPDFAKWVEAIVTGAIFGDRPIPTQEHPEDEPEGAPKQPEATEQPEETTEEEEADAQA